jgi:hypothetical protein
MSYEGAEFLKTPVKRLYPVDDQALHEELSHSGQMTGAVTQSIADIIQVGFFFFLFSFNLVREFCKSTLRALTIASGMPDHSLMGACEAMVRSVSGAA